MGEDRRLSISGAGFESLWGYVKWTCPQCGHLKSADHQEMQALREGFMGNDHAKEAARRAKEIRQRTRGDGGKMPRLQRVRKNYKRMGKKNPV